MGPDGRNPDRLGPFPCGSAARALGDGAQAVAGSPVALAGSLLLILGVTVGLLLLGLSLRRSHLRTGNDAFDLPPERVDG